MPSPVYNQTKLVTEPDAGPSRDLTTFILTWQQVVYRSMATAGFQSQTVNRSGKMLATIIDDAHLMEMENLRRLRLLLEDFPKNHNLILVGQVELLASLDLAVNQDIKSRVTYSVVTRRLHDDVMREFIHRELERIGTAHNTAAQHIHHQPSE